MRIEDDVVDKSTTVPDALKQITENNPIPHLRGWVCPLCGGANGPFVSRCPCVPILNQFIITY